LDIDQLYRIFSRLGTPTQQTWPGLADLPDFNKITFPHMDPEPLERILADAPSNAIALLRKMFVYEPSRRITAQEALLDDYFFSSPAPCHPSALRHLVQLPHQADSRITSLDITDQKEPIWPYRPSLNPAPTGTQLK